MQGCVICNSEAMPGKKLSNHIKKVHGLSSKEYTVKHLYSGIQPTCEICGEETRYVGFTFKIYCKQHARDAMRKAGAIGGHAQAWNKGLTKKTDERIKDQAARMSGSKNPFFGRTHSPETIALMRAAKRLSEDEFQDRISSRPGEFKALTTYDTYLSRQAQYLEFMCLTCQEIQPKTLQAFERGSRCYRCHPFNKSNWELEVFDFVKSHVTDVVSGDRSLLRPKEIDVYTPSAQFGIECHGLYWHSELSPDGVVDKHLTRDKIVNAHAKGVQLMQIFDDEWRDKRMICESLILHRLRLSPERFGARQCKVEKLTTAQQRQFFDASHLAGYTPASKAWGLIRAGDIVAALSLRKPRNRNAYPNMLEVARFATKPKTAVAGGLARLMRQVGGPIMTYVDRRIGLGIGYETCGFKKVGVTGLDYWYTDGVLRYDRFKYRATAGLSEREVALRAGVGRIWGCGSHVLLRQ